MYIVSVWDPIDFKGFFMIFNIQILIESGIIQVNPWSTISS